MEFVKTRSLNQGEKLFRERDSSREIYHLRVGVLLMLKGDLIVGQVKAPAFVGEVGSILGLQRGTTVIAKTSSSVDIYDAAEMMAKLTTQSDLGSKFIHNLVERFDMLRDRAHEYQYLALDECKKILSVLISEKKVEERKLSFSDMKGVRRDVELLIDQVVTRNSGSEDFAAMQQMAKKHNVADKFQDGLNKRFRALTFHDLKAQKIPRVDTFQDFKTAANFICEKIALMLKYVADYQMLGLSHLESELVMMEETLPFAAREQILKEQLLSVYAKGSLDDFKRQVTEFDRAVKTLTEDTGRTDLPLAPLARKFGLGDAYMKSLQTKWMEFIKK